MSDPRRSSGSHQSSGRNTARKHLAALEELIDNEAPTFDRALDLSPLSGQFHYPNIRHRRLR